MFKPLKISVEEAIKRCKERGLLLSVGKIDSIRAICHLDVSFEEIEKTKQIFEEVFS